MGRLARSRSSLGAQRQVHFRAFPKRAGSGRRQLKLLQRASDGKSMRTPPSTQRALQLATCLACGSDKNYQLGHWQEMPLSVINLPRTQAAAKSAPTFELDVRRCGNCGHVFHTRFDPDAVQYKDASNLVFNNGHGWQQYQKELAQRWFKEWNLEGKLVVEVGAGDGEFLDRFRQLGAEVLAFEPGPDAEACSRLGLRVKQNYFGAGEVAHFSPAAIICRHVIEHMADPAEFLREIRLGAVATEQAPVFLAEVPRIDKALEHHRINDFLYEHVSHFTEHSFRVLFEEAGWDVLAMESGYGDEVVNLAARPRSRCSLRVEEPTSHLKSVAESSRRFSESVDTHVHELRERLADWQAAGRTVALWGGTGKGAALINMCGLNADKAPLVIDSDPRKQGAFVPGTAQVIRGPGACEESGVDVILICTQWRARDIEHEIRQRLGLEAELFVVHRGRIAELTPQLEI
ncbi:MAG TPA: methyltransferase domain-containing protein [Planctomycetes bacterium]|nr:methyltransferase domain-containing protein [Planctomycetota bacterium]